MTNKLNTMNLDSFKTEEMKDRSYSTLKITNHTINSVFQIFINENPFLNCQTFTIGYFKSFVNCVEPQDYCKVLIAMKKSNLNLNKPIAIVDVKQMTFNTFKDYLPIRGSFPYKSTNGSNMVIVLIDFSLSALTSFKPKKSK